MCLKGRKKKKNVVEGDVESEVSAKEMYIDPLFIEQKGLEDHKEIEVDFKTVAFVSPTFPGEVTDTETFIKNNSTKKLAYKMTSMNWWTDGVKLVLYKFNFDTAGIIQPGENKKFAIEYYNTRKFPSDVFHWYFTFVESDTVPDEYLDKSDGIQPKNCDADFVQTVKFIAGHKAKLTDELPPEMVIKCLGSSRHVDHLLVLKPNTTTGNLEGDILIWNKSPTKFLAYRIVLRDNKVYRATPRTWVIKPLGIESIKIDCRIPPDETKRSMVHVFYAFTDTMLAPVTLFHKCRTPPTDHPAWFIQTVIKREEGAPGVGPSLEPLSQTGAAITEVDAGAPDAPPGPCPSSGAPTSGTGVTDTGTGAGNMPGANVA